ncbi:hypothetical protein EBR57_07620 [bacterium]|nr:hypothetical protein [bacterium]
MDADGVKISLRQDTLALTGTGNVRSARYDFAYGNYLYQRGFFDELSRVQRDIVAGDEITVNGKLWSMEKPGDMLALQNYMSTLEAAKEGVVGLGRKGLKVEYNSLTNLYSQ